MALAIPHAASSAACWRAGWLAATTATNTPARIHLRRRRPLKSRPQKRTLKATTAHTQEATNLMA
ncbi:hypothetical protein VFPFJ_07991 [Purpureocillium lilacinum]|uniref:Uncharacterized protein n=1 Tax=Purpureocillium lilacinum TaxID=33203 RepID=A0A179H6P8_PURLI|nr:hypothetical protein VFPFJ_07991 [Purpureocillium lilacinum]OAQ85602.1 hypothetical protein VFPFJ_07991 [Purpureocillium lilacinum]